MYKRQEIDRYNISETEGLSLRGINDGKLGYSYTEKVDESSIDMLSLIHIYYMLIMKADLFLLERYGLERNPLFHL